MLLVEESASFFNSRKTSEFRCFWSVQVISSDVKPLVLIWAPVCLSSFTSLSVMFYATKLPYFFTSLSPENERITTNAKQTDPTMRLTRTAASYKLK